MGSHDRRIRPQLAAAVVLAFALIVALVTTSSADPTKRDVADARANLEALNGQLSVLAERLNLARLRLQDVQGRLAETRAEAARAQAEADAAVAALNETATYAYVSVQSQLSALLDSTSFADLSDRVEFLGRLAQADADAATEAARARQEAAWLADRLTLELEEQRAALDEIQRSQDAIRRRIDTARATYNDLSDEYRASLAAAEAAQATTTQAAAASTAPAPVPIVNGSVEAVISAARSVVGSPYVFGAADPAVGFDCSGLTMWAWAHAGVSLPHSSTAQYDALPHIDRSQLQPGDLVFSSYGRLGSGVIDHVALYIGAGQTIAASNPSTGVAYRAIDWDAYVGAARPG